MASRRFYRSRRPQTPRWPAGFERYDPEALDEDYVFPGGYATPAPSQQRIRRSSSIARRAPEKNRHRSRRRSSSVVSPRFTRVHRRQSGSMIALPGSRGERNSSLSSPTRPLFASGGRPINSSLADVFGGAYEDESFPSVFTSPLERSRSHLSSRSRSAASSSRRSRSRSPVRRVVRRRSVSRSPPEARRLSYRVAESDIDSPPRSPVFERRFQFDDDVEEDNRSRRAAPLQRWEPAAAYLDRMVTPIRRNRSRSSSSCSSRSRY